GHRWLAYPLVREGGSAQPTLLGRAHEHWSFFFDADGSVMEGADWEPAGEDTFVMLTPITRYGVLDQYLMGVRTRGEADSFFVVSHPARFTPAAAYTPLSDPAPGIAARGPARKFALADLDAANGPRFPDAVTGPQNVRVAFALVVPRGSAAAASDL